MKIVIVDDEVLARERLRRMIETFPGWDVIGAAGNGFHASTIIKATQPDV